MILDKQKGDISALLVLLYLEMARRFNESPTKAVIKMAKQLLPKLDAEVAYSTVIPIIGSRDPLKVLADRQNLWFKLKLTREQFVEAGHHGMLIYEKTIYPISLNIESQEELDEAIAMENELFGRTGEVFANQNNLISFEGHLMFFQEWGFSGDFKALNCKRSASVGQTALMKMAAVGAANKAASKKKAK